MRSKGRLTLIAVLAAVGFAGLRGRLRRYEIAEQSMQPTLRPGDYVVAVALDADPERGDIVIYEHPRHPGLELVKRVVGLPGETVVISNGQIHANDAVLAEPWAEGPTFPDAVCELSQDQIFVVGDNRAASTSDSRTLGPIDVGGVRWKVIARYWPVQSMGRVAI